MRTTLNKLLNVVVVGLLLALSSGFTHVEGGQDINVSVACGISSGGQVIGQGKIDNEHRVTLQVQGPTGPPVTVTGEMGASGTARSLCESLKSSMGAAGCNATYTDKDPSQSNEILKANDQVLTLPDGWHVVGKVKVEKNLEKKGGKPRWDDCSKSSHLTVTPVVTGACAPDGSAELVHLGFTRSHEFPFGLTLKFDVVDAQGQATEFVYGQVFTETTAPTAARTALLAALASEGFEAFPLPDTSGEVLLLVPEGSTLGEIAFSMSYEAFEEGSTDPDEEPSDDAEPEMMWVSIESLLAVY
ncbi:MAG: hypothetical protein EPO68_09770 [Planctomycetota bacterium]|nr:MAG: hypothetical protein EPO68_09770 [Planctomycetota bacterium]